jgi:hypothetical protein
MGVGYELVNVTSRERLMFVHIPANAMREIAGNPIASAMAPGGRSKVVEFTMGTRGTQ